MRNVIDPVYIDGAQMDGDIEGEWLNTENLLYVGFAFTWTDDADGSLILQFSSDKVTAHSLTSPTPIATGGSPGTGYFELKEFPWPFLRIFYDRSAGDGLLTAEYDAKGF